MANNALKDICELDDILRFDSPLKTGGEMPRWQRKEMQRSNSDRFIPNRSAMDLAVSHMELTHSSCENANPDVESSPAKQQYKESLAESLFDGRPEQQNKILAFKEKPAAPKEGYQNNLRVLFSQNQQAATQPRKFSRQIAQAPERILDAPELVDDYYLNLLSWNKSNILAVALGDSVYLWNANNGGITQLMQLEEGNYVTSIDWVGEGNYIAVGLDDTNTTLWDTERCKQVRSMGGHRARVSSLSWNEHILSSGSRDSTIVNHDVRIANHHVSTLQGHQQEVCGLKWSPNGQQLASGGNDNLLNIWDARLTSSIQDINVHDNPLFQMNQHQAAVKALAWCPWQKNLLASGGGTADRMIRFWNTQTGACLNAVDTKSQVCALQWSPHDKELLSSHGFSHNQLILWKYPSMVKMAELTGHTARVLHMAASPDGMTVASAAADETLRFWKIFSGGEKQAKSSENKPFAATRSIR